MDLIFIFFNQIHRFIIQKKDEYDYRTAEKRRENEDLALK
jgi:hypothetical protein